MCFSLLEFKLRVDQHLSPWLISVSQSYIKSSLGESEESVKSKILGDTLNLINLNYDSKQLRNVISYQKDKKLA